MCFVRRLFPCLVSPEVAPVPLRFSCACFGRTSGRLLLTRKTRYRWMANPYRIWTSCQLTVNRSLYKRRQASLAYQRFQNARSCRIADMTPPERSEWTATEASKRQFAIGQGRLPPTACFCCCLLCFGPVLRIFGFCLLF